MWIKTRDARFIDVRNGVLEFVNTKDNGGKSLQFVPFGGKAVVLCDSLSDTNARNLNHSIEQAFVDGKRLMELPSIE